MEDVLRWSLLVLGSCIIIGVLVHGILTSRKNSEKKSTAQDPDQELTTDTWAREEQHTSKDDLGSINFDLGEETLQPLSDDEQQPIVSNEQFDDLGIGAVRVVSSATAEGSSESDETKQVVEDIDASNVVLKTEQAETKKVEPASKIYASVVTQPKPEYAAKLKAEETDVNIPPNVENVPVSEAATSSLNVSNVSTTEAFAARVVQGNAAPDGYDAPEPPPFLLKQENEVAITNTQSPAETTKPLSIKESLTEQAFNLVKRKKAEASKKRREPKITEDQMRIDFDDEPKAPQVDESQSSSNQSSANSQPQEVLVLNLKVGDDSEISGAALLPMLLTLGFKFGDQDIFHRHVNSSGKGPVLFSLANMFKPGNFDINNMENFSSKGLSLFMILPIEGDPHQVFNMMHNAARKLSDEFSAQIYDGKRTLLTKQSLQQYVEKIREFERLRMVNR